MMKLKLVFFLLVPFAVFAQGSSTGSTQLTLPFQARTASLSNAVVAHPSSFAAFAINPAALGMSERTEILLSHAEWIQDMQLEFIGVRLPQSFGTLAFSVFSTSVGGIELRDKPGPPDGIFTARFAALQGSYANQLFDDVTVGATIKYLYEKIFVDETNGYAFDVGLHYRTPFEGVTAGLAMTNIGRMATLRNEHVSLPTQLRAGAAWVHTVGDYSLLSSVDLEQFTRLGSLNVLAGIEVTYAETLALRFGLNPGHDTRTVSGGIGIFYRLFKLEYGYVPFSSGLGRAHILSLGFVF
jgi:hypothetical protein